MYIAIDQYGQTFRIKQHPRKELCEQLGSSHADIMYQDKKDGSTVKTGYVIAGLWLSIFKLTPIERAV